MWHLAKGYVHRLRPAGWVAVYLVFLAPLAARAASPLETPPLPPSPIQQFRDWLAMSPADREKAVAAWPEEKRKVLLEKLRTYEALPAAERDRRLQMAEFRWYLRPLMGLPPKERTNTLQFVPPALKHLIEERYLIEERLRHWDSLPAEDRRQILQNDTARELVTNFYLRLQSGRSKEEILRSLDPVKRSEVEEALRTWEQVPPSARSRTAEQLTRFFQLPPSEQARTVAGLSESDRHDVQRTLDAFARLSPEQRRICVESFQKFALMPPPERASFLRNAARWQAMTPEDRATWKELVTKLPPLPPLPVPEPPFPSTSPNPNKVATSSSSTP
jgi:hypothetical protein